MAQILTPKPSTPTSSARPSPPRRLTCARTSCRRRAALMLWAASAKPPACHYLVAELFMVPLDAVDGDADSVRLPGRAAGHRGVLRVAEGANWLALRRALRRHPVGGVLRRRQRAAGARPRRHAARAAGAGATPGARLGPRRVVAAEARRTSRRSSGWRGCVRVMTNIPFAPAEAVLAGGAGRRRAGSRAAAPGAARRPAARRRLGGGALLGMAAAHRRRLRPVGARLVRADAAVMMASTPHGFKWARRGRRR